MSKYPAEYHRNYYHEKVDKKKKQAKQAERRARVYAHITEYLTHHPCVDCGEPDPIVLEFDHVRGAKLFNLGDAVRLGYGIARIDEEINKCDVRCANCHRRVTFSRRKG